MTCRAWRQEVAVLLGEGYSDEEIIDRFATQYGDKISGVPVSTNDRNLALVFPAMAGLFLAVVVGWQVWNMRQRGENRALAAARAAGNLEGFSRPVPDNVDPIALRRLLKMVEERQ
ncbi:MAG: hypothetical protein HC915_06985 [Anaerolineae bacterium]|nr:hypothetical protein [Anaerolineae bacterium]